MKASVVTTAIADTLVKLDMTAKQACHGNCDTFAEAVQARALELGATVKVRGTDWYSADPEHVWVEYKGKHYDAEAPLGVKRWRQLPIMLQQ